MSRETKAQKAEKAEVIEMLRKWLPPGTTSPGAYRSGYSLTQEWL